MKCTGGRESRFLVCLHVSRPSPVISTVTRKMTSLSSCVSSVSVMFLLLGGCDWRNDLAERSTEDTEDSIAYSLFVDGTIDELVARVDSNQATAAIIYGEWVCCADPRGGLGRNTITNALADRQIVTMSVDLTNIGAGAMSPLSDMGVTEIPALLLFDPKAGRSPVILTSNESNQTILAAIARMDS